MGNKTHQDTWEAYTSSWSDTDAETRKTTLEQNLNSDCTYTDPNIQTVGYQSLSNYMAQFQQGFPGAKFVTTAFREHHNQSLAHWNMVNVEGEILSKGASFGEYATDRRLTKMTGFFWDA
ncbi:MAG: nuclear transport factor 2 family protein [Acidobacteria bacterium]|nr:nuclear transport factor 2 family protein [Acidobacteriota bacterium]MBI3428394.1 nuclear transport factor 2 family protein [Acidobacteriota bacterium]